jgi:radical SAM superfamily enzyme YgiQ (UPF0313 family)
LNRPRSALLISPPIYDTQYWSHWSLPYGLLRVASWLRTKGYVLKLIDCLEANNRKRSVSKQMRKVRRLCSTDEYVPPRWSGFRPADDEKIEYCFGLPAATLLKRLEAIKAKSIEADESLFEIDVFPEPDEIWISSIMTYWWESTRDVISVCREVFPKAVIRVGGIYPTLAPEHAIEKLGLRNPLHLQGRELDPLAPEQQNRDIIVSATIPDANPLPLALDLYQTDDKGDVEVGDGLPSYTILTTSRGCPFKCAYCAANVLNEGRKVWVREFASAYDEVKYWFAKGIHEFCFYEDNLLLGKSNFIELIRRIADDPDLDGIELHAPEGIEVRLLHPHVVQLMRRAGFKKLYLPLETVNANMRTKWDRTHTNMDKFFYGLQNALEAGFKAHCQDINCFVLFGLPDEDLQAVYDTLVFASTRVGSVIPMLFTPVPSTPMFEMYRDYIEDKGFDFQHLNGKLLPFLDYNRRKYPRLSPRDYFALEGLMWRVNTKVRSESFSLGGAGRVSKAFREVFTGYTSQ